MYKRKVRGVHLPSVGRCNLENRLVQVDTQKQEPLPKKEKPETKKVLVVSDGDRLFEVIKINLEKIPVAVDRIENASNGNGHRLSNVEQYNLIVVASGSSTSEPVVSLFNASLTKQIGQIPLLIISDRQFDANESGQIFHLDFPFNATELRKKVKQLVKNSL